HKSYSFHPHQPGIDAPQRANHQESFKKLNKIYQIIKIILDYI
ncbi:unnamed protein product, partial [marine sediment metagenome]